MVIAASAIFGSWWFQLILVFLICMLFFLYKARHTGGKVTTNNSTYLNKEKSRVVDQHDIYMRSEFKREKRN